MPTPVEPSARANALVRDAIAVTRFPWIRPLVSAFAANDARIQGLFAGNPADPAAWTRTIARVSGAARSRAELVSVLSRQLERRGAPPEARHAAEKLSAPNAVAIMTGQQPGLFGGPLYTLLKAVTAIQLARHVSSTHNVPAVPVFWVEADDHDWVEARSARALNKDAGVYATTAADLAGAGRQPVGRLILDASIEDALSQFGDQLPPTEFTAELMTGLRRRYRPGVGFAAAFAAWLDDLLGRHGLVVFEADDPAAKSLAADIFAAELESPRTATLAREGAAALTAAGHPPQVDPAADAVALFYLDDAGRLPIKRHAASGYQIGERTVPVADLAREATSHPERFSPNVLLRPVVQDRMFPTVCNVAGPSELAYQAQIGGVYRAFGVEPPLLYNRVSATLLDSGAVKFLDRSGLPLEALQPQDERALNELLARELPPDLERKIGALHTSIADGVNALRHDVASVDATLSGAVDTTISRMQESVHTLQSKVIQAAKRKDDTLRRQFARTRALTCPDGAPQERALCSAFFLNRYGLTLPDRLLEVLPLDTSHHYLIAI